MELTLDETEDTLHCHTNYFTLDRLLTYANKLFKSKPLKIEILI
ncbi:MAG: hypothetical protein MRERC_8c015 [Mycoplasmataceae bacterium RC_NB112A]|nr:MAG: hypothetical protein MRERC_8c015 [Mycoplasmataceae bacterium RC_NB112A]